MDEPFRLRYVNQLTGVFILFIIAGLLLFTMYLVRVKELLGFLRAVAGELAQAMTEAAQTGLERESHCGVRLGMDIRRLAARDWQRVARDAKLSFP